MNREIVGHIIRFIVLIALQIVVLNNVHFSGMLNPYLYVYFLLVLPVDFPPNIGLLLGFIMGLAIDIFSQTLGMHTIATVFLAYGRPYVLRYMAPRDGYEFTRDVSAYRMGWLWFLTYSSIMVFLHHFVLFFIESFRMSGLWFTLWKSIGSSVLTMVLILVIQLFFGRNPSSTKAYE